MYHNQPLQCAASSSTLHSSPGATDTPWSMHVHTCVYIYVCIGACILICCVCHPLLQRYVTITMVSNKGTWEELYAYAGRVAAGYRPPISPKLPQQVISLIQVRHGTVQVLCSGSDVLHLIHWHSSVLHTNWWFTCCIVSADMGIHVTQVEMKAASSQLHAAQGLWCNGKHTRIHADGRHYHQ
jgi:hypothetical protein